MRKFLTIICLIISLFGFTQNQTGSTLPLPNWNYVGSRFTLTEIKGVLRSTYGIILSRWADTATANTDPYIKFYAGMQIVIGDDVWVRNSTATTWVKISGGSGGGSIWGSITGTLSNQTDLQTALNLKANLASPTFTGTVVIPTPFTLGAVSVLPTGTELNFVDGVTSAIQTQLDGKQPLDADLTTIAGLTATTDNFIVSVSSAWASRTPTQVKTTLGATTIGNNFFTLTNPSAIRFPRINADNTVSALDASTFFTAIGGIAPLFPTTGTGTATGNVIGNISSNMLQVQSGGNDFLTIDPTLNVERAILQAYNTTGNDNVSNFRAVVGTNGSDVSMAASFNGGVKESEILAEVDATTAEITYSADTHIFIGNILPLIDNTYDIGSTAISFKDIYLRTLKLDGSTSGTVTIQTAAVAGTYTLTLPIDDGTASQFLQTNGSGVLTWATPAGGGNVTKVGTPSNDQLAVWTGDGTLEGEDNLRFSISTLYIGVAGSTTGTLVLNGSTSGTITIKPANAAGTYTLTLPTDDGTANQVLTTDGAGILSWTTASGGGANTALSNLAAVAINTSLISDADNTDDLGSAAIGWKDIYSRTLKLDGSTSGTVTFASDALANTTNITTLSGIGYGCSCMEATETSDFTGQNISTVQPVFNTAQDVWTLQAATSYDFEATYIFSHGATSHSVGLSFELGGGASVTSITYSTIAWVTAPNTNTTSQNTNLIITETNTAVNFAGANATENIIIKGTIRMNAGGTVTPSYTFSAAPGGTVLTKAGTTIKFCPKGTNTMTSIGNVN